MALMGLSPLSGMNIASFPHVLESSGIPPVPNPILESQLVQLICSLPRIPILTLDAELRVRKTLNPSLLQSVCREAWEPTSVFHVVMPSEVARYCPLAINEY